jgi:RimJ/RimL family protein N-acetyltransferase
MIGDVNLFFNDPDNDKTFAEIEIMIAEENFRRFGYGIEAITMMMAYGKNLVDLHYACSFLCLPTTCYLDGHA